VRYLNAPGVVLVRESVARRRGIADGSSLPAGYDFGGDPDVVVDLVESEDHHFCAFLDEDGVEAAEVV
jgi:hypothetical protein